MVRHWPLFLVGTVVSGLALWGLLALLGTGIVGITLIVTALISTLINIPGGRTACLRQWYSSRTMGFDDYLVYVFMPTLGVLAIAGFAGGIIGTINAGGHDAFSLGWYAAFWVITQAAASWYLFGKHIKRNPTRSVRIGSISVGCEHPIAVQSMTATHTQEIDDTVEQVNALHAAGIDGDVLINDCTTESFVNRLDTLTLGDQRKLMRAAITLKKKIDC